MNELRRVHIVYLALIITRQCKQTHVYVHRSRFMCVVGLSLVVVSIDGVFYIESKHHVGRTMGNVGLWIFLAAVFTFDVLALETKGTSGSTCINQCHSSGKNKECADAQLSWCSNATNTTEDVEDTILNRPPPELFSLSLIPTEGGNSTNSYGLSFSWLHHNDSTEINSYAVKVYEYDSLVIADESLRALKISCDTLTVPRNPPARILHFEHVCWNDLKPGTNYSIQLTSLPHNISLQYYFKTPENFTTLFYPSSVADWRTVVAIASARLNQSSVIYTVFQPAPSEYNISDYDIVFTDGIMQNELSYKNDDDLYPARYKRNTTLSEDKLVQAEVRATHSPPYYTSTSPFITVHAASVPDGPTSAGSHLTTTHVPTTTTPETATSTGNTDNTPVTTGTHVEPPADSSKRKTVIISVSVVAAVVLIGVVIGIVYYLVKKKQCCVSGNFPMRRFKNQDDSGSALAIDMGFKRTPTVLILYSFDCEAHESVVVEFASYLKHVVGCDVSMDIWEQAEIQSRGVYDWIKEKLQCCEFVIIVCSTGARFKCVRHKQFNVKETRPVPDIFQEAVELVAENMRADREAATNQSKYIVTYFEYSRDTDIPPKLDTVDFYLLMRDIFKLFCHIHDIPSDSNHYRSYHGLSVETYTNTETGLQLHAAIDQANRFFEDNPNWLGDTLEPVATPTPPPATPSPNHEQLPPGGPPPPDPDAAPDSQEDSPARPGQYLPESSPVKSGHSRVSSASLSVASEEDALIDERRRKRKKELMGSLDRMRKGKPARVRNDSLDSISNGGGSPAWRRKPLLNGLDSVVEPEPEPPGGKGRRSEHGLNGTGPDKERADLERNGNIPAITHPPYHTAFKHGHYYSQHRRRQEDEESFVDDDRQLQRDIEHIQNYDLHHRAQAPLDISQVKLQQTPFVAGYSPPNGYEDSAGLSFSNKLYDLHMGPGGQQQPAACVTNGLNNNVLKNNLNDNNNISDFHMSFPQLPPPGSHVARTSSDGGVHQISQVSNVTTSF